MKITLCYKEYDCKVSLGAMKAFKQATGKCLWLTLLEVYDAFIKTRGMSELDRQKAIYSAISFDDAVHLFDAVTDKSVTTAEIDDAMYHSAWRTYEGTTDKNQPWSLQLVNLAIQYDQEMKELQTAKKSKPATSQADETS